MRYLEEHGIGYETGFAKVPLVCQSCIYDLGIGRADVRPDAAMGYAACENAERNQPESGIIGAGTGASVGERSAGGNMLQKPVLESMQSAPENLKLLLLWF